MCVVYVCLLLVALCDVLCMSWVFAGKVKPRAKWSSPDDYTVYVGLRKEWTTRDAEFHSQLTQTQWNLGTIILCVCVSFFSYSYIVNIACRDYTPNTVGRAIKCAQVDLVYSPTTACRGDPREHKRRWSKNASMYIHILQHSNMRFLRLYVSLKSFFLSRRVFSVFTTCRVCRTGCSAWVTLN